jgi:hypothetical protein
MVCDLQLQCADVSACASLATFFGTTIHVLFRPEISEKNSFKLFATRNFLLNCCGATNAHIACMGDKKKIDIVLKTLEGSQIVNEKIGSQESVLYADQFASSFHRPALLQSYITTNGVPFRPLADVAKQLNLLPRNLLSLIEDGVVIDLPLGIYEPVQSRTQLKISAENKHNFSCFMREIAFRNGLSRAQHDEQLLDLYFTHYLSSAEFGQLKPSSDGFGLLEKVIKEGNSFLPFNIFFRYHHLLDQSTSTFYDKIMRMNQDFVVPQASLYTKSAMVALDVWPEQNGVHQCISDDEKSEFKQRWCTYVAELAGQLNAQLNQEFDAYKQSMLGSITDKADKTLWNIAFQWFERKFGTTIKKVPRVGDLTEKYPHLRTIQETQQLADVEKKIKDLVQRYNYCFKTAKALNHALEHYCNLVLPGTKGQFYAEAGSTLGFWDGSGIKINLASISIAAQLRLIQKLAQGQLASIPEDSAYQTLFAPLAGSAPTVVHELEHAARHSNHNSSGSHDDGVDIHGKHTSFDACATARVRQAVQNGLLEQWSEAVKVFLDEKYRGSIKYALDGLERIIPEIEKLELAYPQEKAILAKALLES